MSIVDHFDGIPDFEITGAVLDTVGALVVVVDRDGRIEYFNKTSEMVSGFTAHDVIGRSLVDTLVPIEQRGDVTTVIVDLLEPGTNQLENDWITADGGRRRIVWTNTNVTDADGHVTNVIGTGIDVTDQRLLESRLAQADRLDSIGRLTAGIVHDFNNTLTTLRLRIDRLLARDLDRESRADVEAITNTISRTQNLIARLLLFSSEQELAPVEVDVNAEVRGTRGALGDLLGCDIAMLLELSADDTTAMIDLTGFEQVLTNLTINARDAMPDGGILTISTSIETIEPDTRPSLEVPSRLAAGSYVVVAVGDTGIGIARDDLPHLFDPYYTTKPAGQGTGLGLAIAYGFLAQSGGAIDVTSEVGVGTTFRIWLPRD